MSDSDQNDLTKLNQNQRDSLALGREQEAVNHLLHFLLTLVTLGLWGLVWWHLILKSQGKAERLFHGFDDAYWSHLIEREQPPAALHTFRVDAKQESAYFEA
ncbi:DUF4234 domain-containing protein [Shewanella loihica]|uniref:Uncharacterized protein n=1 Tax=Shewanella loihica (strain ATCC BAA-1088 / PV-4) TaxID=323850 RepID=A3QAW6_SHELP|nr:MULTISPECIES: DUF4234 domain-containing protein [Shewanella]ABO22614.1 hypothetical protein Shew_0742 [Shewanella loihica PV-4]